MKSFAHHNEKFSHSLPLKDREQPLKFMRSASNYRIGVDIRQPSFISLRGQIVTKSGETIGQFSQDDEKTTLDQINLVNNNGQFDNPIIVIDDDSKEFCCNEQPLDLSKTLTKPFIENKNENTNQPLPIGLFQKKLQSHLYKKHASFWKEIGYKPNFHANAETVA